MFVIPAHRDQQLSSNVLLRLELEAVRLGYHTLCLAIGDLQVETSHLYERSGFRRIAPLGNDADGDSSVYLEKRLQ